MEGRVGYTNGVLVAQRAIIAPDGNFEHGVAVCVEAAVSIVVAGGICC